MTEKYIIWDVVNNCWFKPTYPGFITDSKGKQHKIKVTKEIFFSQSGEMYIRFIDNEGVESFTHTEDFRAYSFSGAKDLQEKKIYAGAIVKHSKKGLGEIVNESLHWQIRWHNEDKSKQNFSPLFCYANFGLSMLDKEDLKDIVEIVEHSEEVRLRTQTKPE